MTNQFRGIVPNHIIVSCRDLCFGSCILNVSFSSSFQVMKGNDDSSGIELTALDPPLLTRFIRIVPLQPADSQAKKVCLQLGFYGCRDKSKLK